MCMANSLGGTLVPASIAPIVRHFGAELAVVGLAFFLLDFASGFDRVL